MFGVVLVSQMVGMVLAGGVALLRAEPLPGPADLGWAALGGLVGVLGIVCLYQGLAIGRVTVVAADRGRARCDDPGQRGLAVAGRAEPTRIAGIGPAGRRRARLVVLGSRSAARPAGVRYGILAGIGSGLFNVCASRFSPGVVFGPLVVVRAVEALAWSPSSSRPAAWRLERSVAPGDGRGRRRHGGNGFFVPAAQAGRLDIAGVLSSLYPVTRR